MDATPFEVSYGSAVRLRSSFCLLEVATPWALVSAMALASQRDRVTAHASAQEGVGLHVVVTCETWTLPTGQGLARPGLFRKREQFNTDRDGRSRQNHDNNLLQGVDTRPAAQPEPELIIASLRPLRLRGGVLSQLAALP